MVGGRGRLHWRVLRDFRCLGSSNSGPIASMALRFRTRGLSAAFRASSLGSNLKEEGADLGWDGDRIEEEGAGWVMAP